MGFWDRFKKRKEQEVEKKVSAAIEVAEVKEPREKATKEKPVKAAKKEVPKALARILVRPLVTEKAATLTSSGQYVFEVDLKANRHQVAAAVFAVYGIKPVKVGILNMRREPVRFGRGRGMRKAWKKAIVRLPKGKTISVHEGV